MTPEEQVEVVNAMKQLEGTMFKDALANANYVIVKFYKRDGSIRDMKCTTNPTKFKNTYEKKTAITRDPKEGVVSVWDLEEDAWRSIRLDSIIDWAGNYAD
jgi:hypothetical protein